MSESLEIAGWLVSLVAVGGVVLNNYGRRLCFVVWIFSNAATAALHLMTAAPMGLVARDVVFLALAVHGWLKWSKR